MNTAIANETYSIVGLGEVDTHTKHLSDMLTTIDQYKGDRLEVWKKRGGGFLFVYCNRLEIGYWVHPRLINVQVKKIKESFYVEQLERQIRINEEANTMHKKEIAELKPTIEE
tara:strand:+ start:659 stop:997 length:339 start_codon:yes stop_codon:yes gene_type:complete